MSLSHCDYSSLTTLSFLLHRPHFSLTIVISVVPWLFARHNSLLFLISKLYQWCYFLTSQLHACQTSFLISLLHFTILQSSSTISFLSCLCLQCSSCFLCLFEFLAHCSCKLFFFLFKLSLFSRSPNTRYDIFLTT
jgi:hypothetical protein